MSTTLEALLAIQGTLLLHENKGGAAGGEPATTLDGVRGNRAVVYDFWTTRCTNCPAALDALDAIARERPGVAFVGVNIDDAGLAGELVAKAASEGRWTSLTHAHLGEDEKEKAKKILGMRTVPFYVVVSEAGKVLRHGNAKALPLKTAASLDSVLLGIASEPASASASVSAAPGGVGGESESEKQKENDATAANANASRRADGAPLMECEGGVCKLVRKPKNAAGPEEQATKEPVAAAAVAAVEPSAAAPAGAMRTVECEGGVCKLVRKPKNAAEAAASASAVEKKREEAEVEESSLAVGDMMPPLKLMPLDEGAAATTVDDVRAGGRAVLDFWTTRCVRCPAALDALEGLALKAKGESPGAAGVKYVSLNLDNLEGARGMLSGGRWPSLSHLFAGGYDESSETLLERFKARAGLKSVPFYVVLAADGRIEQMGGPKAVKLGTETVSTFTGPEAAAASPKVGVASGPETVASAPAPAPAPKAIAFTMDDDF
eukprot:g6130.t1